LVPGVFTFLAIAYSTTRAATQSKAFTAGRKKGGAIALGAGDDSGELGGVASSGPGIIRTQPTPKNTPRYQALVAAVDVGAIPASALNDRTLYAEAGDTDSEDEGDSSGVFGEERDDERVAVRYNVTILAPYFPFACQTDIVAGSIHGST
jgi:serine incorporator 1/3